MRKLTLQEVAKLRERGAIIDEPRVSAPEPKPRAPSSPPPPPVQLPPAVPDELLEHMDKQLQTMARMVEALQRDIPAPVVQIEAQKHPAKVQVKINRGSNGLIESLDIVR